MRTDDLEAARKAFRERGQAGDDLLDLAVRWALAERERWRANVVLANAAARVGRRLDELDQQEGGRGVEVKAADRALLDAHDLAASRLMDAGRAADDLQRQLKSAAAELLDADLCAQCRANTTANERGGYFDAADNCRTYCRSGHSVADPAPRLEP